MIFVLYCNCIDFINKSSVLFWYQNWFWEPWIFTGIGTEYRNVGTVTTLIKNSSDFLGMVCFLKLVVWWCLSSHIMNCRLGSVASREDPTHWCCAEPVHLPSPREHPAACGVWPLPFTDFIPCCFTSVLLWSDPSAFILPNNYWVSWSICI